MKIRFAVTPPAAALDEDAFGGYLEACEQFGFDTVWLSDLPLGPLGDPLVSLAFAAGCTRRLKLGANLVPLGRNPLWLAKQLAHLDRLSHGRLLLSFVPGLGAPAERAALGYASGDRGRAMEDVIALLRRWWAGETVTAEGPGQTFDALALEPRPLQQPLEIWLGGKGPAALERVARIADGWLTSALTPAEAGRARESIEQRAAALGRCVDAEHFGVSIPLSAGAPGAASLAALSARRADGDVSGIVAVGSTALRALVADYVTAGLSKFVVRPLDTLDGAGDWHDDLARLADALLPLQT